MIWSSNLSTVNTRRVCNAESAYINRMNRRSPVDHYPDFLTTSEPPCSLLSSPALPAVPLWLPCWRCLFLPHLPSLQAAGQHHRSAPRLIRPAADERGNRIAWLPRLAALLLLIPHACDLHRPEQRNSGTSGGGHAICGLGFFPVALGFIFLAFLGRFLTALTTLPCHYCRCEGKAPPWISPRPSLFHCS